MTEKKTAQPHPYESDPSWYNRDDRCAASECRKPVNDPVHKSK